jgi:DNA mismatch repair protein MLH1
MSRPLTTPTPPRAVICQLPQEVVDQIAAGEVVQRPASVVKELLENCLDAGATHIIVHVEKGGLTKLSISDNGCGIPKSEFALAATRHATSKLTCVQDFAALQTFGFRGEALASVSMVSRLTITSRTADSAVAFSQTYRNANGNNGITQSQQPKPCARKPGTTILVQDLFYNVPHRLKTYSKRESEEYSKILVVVQHYAIHYPHCGFVCQRTTQTSKTNKATLVDVNTGQLKHVQALMGSKSKSKSKEEDPPSQEEIIQATQQIISHVLESSTTTSTSLESHLLHLESSHTGQNPTDFTYDCQVYYTSPAYITTAKKTSTSTQFILFLNDRLVDLPVLKRTLEDVYAEFVVGKQHNKPILVVTVTVPGTQVDVNVHPSKRQVALMYQDELCAAIANSLRDSLQAQGQAFQAQSVKQKVKVVPVLKNPYTTTTPASKKRKHPTTPTAENENEDPNNTPDPKPASSSSRKKKRTPPSQLIRTNRAAPVGAIEPFLVSTQPTKPSQTQSPSAVSESNENNTYATPPSQDDGTHTNECPLSGLDLSQPGAFALRCTCSTSAPTTYNSINNSNKNNPKMVLRIQRPIVRPKRVIPTHCSYASLVSLRKRVNQHANTKPAEALSKQLRDAYFVGVVSHQRTLVQCGEQLVLWNHLELGKELFYQLALARFGGATMAQLGDGGVNVQTIIAQALQLEDDLILLQEEERERGDIEVTLQCQRRRQESGLMLEVNQTNQNLAQQATTCLMDSAGMLEEYFKIRIERQEHNDDDDENRQVVLTGLPVLLDGHAPEPHGLAIFLLRLATQVDWAEERPCFQGICQELGNYYAMLPSDDDDDDLEAYVQHTLFPAISYLLLPSERHISDGNVTVMTKLSTLYKVFERC